MKIPASSVNFRRKKNSCNQANLSGSRDSLLQILSDSDLLFFA
jgi:hypothetical protein